VRQRPRREGAGGGALLHVLRPRVLRRTGASDARAHAARGGQRLLSPSRKAVLAKLPIFETCAPEMVMRGAGRAEAQGREGARAPETTRFVSLDEPLDLEAHAAGEAHL
jgi:hypothetical protein